MNGGVVNQQGVGLLSMFTQSLPVVTDHRDQGRVEKLPRFEVRDDLAHHRVGVGDFSRVRIDGITSSKRIGRSVRSMGIVEVDPGKERLPPSAALEPTREGVVHGVGTAFRGQVFLSIDVAPVALVIYVESLREPEVAIQDEGADERGGLITVFVENFSQRQLILGKAVGPVVANAVDGGVIAGHDRSVRGQRQRNRCSGPREVDTAPGQTVEVRCGTFFEPLQLR